MRRGTKLHCFEIEDIRTGRITTMRGKSRMSVEKRLGKRADDVFIRKCKPSKRGGRS